MLNVVRNYIYSAQAYRALAYSYELKNEDQDFLNSLDLAIRTYCKSGVIKGYSAAVALFEEAETIFTAANKANMYVECTSYVVSSLVDAFKAGTVTHAEFSAIAPTIHEYAPSTQQAAFAAALSNAYIATKEFMSAAEELEELAKYQVLDLSVPPDAIVMTMLQRALCVTAHAAKVDQFPDISAALTPTRVAARAWAASPHQATVRDLFESAEALDWASFNSAGDVLVDAVRGDKSIHNLVDAISEGMERAELGGKQRGVRASPNAQVLESLT